jgi:O-acetyl-ADP-ribose deacetylase (regulator of RNase III)
MKKESFERIEILTGDITHLSVDAIVNAANTSLLGGGGVDGAIHRAAGPELLAECRTIGGCPTGEARITRGYNLPARYVIHTVGPVYDRSRPDRSEDLLRSCYLHCLRLAVENKVQTIAFPAISCGVYGYPIGDACSVAIKATCSVLDQDSTIQRVIFTLFSGRDKKVYSDYLEKNRPS